MIVPKQAYTWSRWRRIRKEVLDANPLCEDCSRVPPVQVAHIEPRSEGGAFFDKSNLRALCLPCHKKRDEWRRKLNRSLKWQRQPPPF